MSWGIEFYLDKIDTYLKANLNTKLTAINTANSDSILVAIDDAAIEKQFIDDVPNYNPFLLFGVIDPITTEGFGEITTSTFNIDVIIFFVAEDKTTDYKRVWRYQQALQELFEDGYNSIFRAVKAKIKGLTPESFVMQDETQLQRAVGVSLEVTLT